LRDHGSGSAVPEIVGMTAAPSLRQHIRGERIKLPKQYFERSVAWTVVFAARPFLWIAAALVLTGSGTWMAWPAAVAALLVAQRHFQTLVHDASHNFYHRTTRINDVLANWLAAGWIGMTVENYRRIHFQHHAHNGSADDPEHVSFATVAIEGGLLKMVLRYACLLEALRLIKKYYGGKSASGTAGKAGAPKRSLVPLHIVGTQLVLAVMCWWLGLAVLYPLWLYLAVTWSPLLSRLRFLVEHPGEDDTTVSTRSTLLEKLFFAPLNFNFHFEHHAWPGLPPYRLRQANRYLLREGFYDRHSEYANESFIGSLARRDQEHRAGQAVAVR
jgi:fatty acid desaturase